MYVCLFYYLLPTLQNWLTSVPGTTGAGLGVLASALLPGLGLGLLKGMLLASIFDKVEVKPKAHKDGDYRERR